MVTTKLDLSDGNPSNRFFDEPMPFRPAVRGAELRAAARRRLAGACDVRELRPEDLRALYDAYDILAFEGHLTWGVTHRRFEVCFEFGATVEDGVAGLGACRVFVLPQELPVDEFGFPYRWLEIRIDRDLLQSAFAQNVEPVVIDGVRCDDPLDAVLVVLEHELLHLYEGLRYGVQSHGAMFKHLGSELFGHVLNDDHIKLPVTGCAVGVSLPKDHSSTELSTPVPSPSEAPADAATGSGGAA